MSNLSSVSSMGLLSGQGCDTLLCPELDELWNFPGVLIDEFRDSPTPTDDGTLYPHAPPATKPDLELNMVAPKTAPDECRAFAADSQTQASWDSQEDSQSTNLRPCEEAIGQIIWLRGCGNTEQNERTATILSRMDGQYDRTRPR